MKLPTLPKSMISGRGSGDSSTPVIARVDGGAMADGLRQLIVGFVVIPSVQILLALPDHLNYSLTTQKPSQFTRYPLP